MDGTSNIFGTLIVIVSMCIFIGVLIGCMWFAYHVTIDFDFTTETEPISRTSEFPTESLRRRIQFMEIQSSSVFSREHNQEMELREMTPQQETSL